MKSYNRSIPSLHTLQRLGHNSIYVSIEQSLVMHQYHGRLSLQFDPEFGPGSFELVLLFGVSGPPLGLFKR